MADSTAFLWLGWLAPELARQSDDAIADDVSAFLNGLTVQEVVLGSPYLIEGNLLGTSSMHDVCWCQDPSEQLETVADEWNVGSGHDAFYVRGLNGAQRAGLGVYNSEYIIFQPYQVLPLYQVDYVIE